MNEIIPPAEPKPESTEKSTPPPPEPPSFGGMIFLGVVLVIISSLLCIPFQNAIPLILAGLVAILSLFAEGYRGIFIGFVSVIGVVLLGFVIICGPILFRH